MTETWQLKISCSATLYADSLYTAASRRINSYSDPPLEVSIRGKVVTVSGNPGTLFHLASCYTRDMEKGYLVKVAAGPKEN